MPLSPDLPKTEPTEDLFGHAPFAEQLAKSIGRQSGDTGLVLALHGPWGAGKSTVLSYVRHYLSADPATQDVTIVDFNPWWFAGREDLAQAFLRQLQAVLPSKNEKLRELGSLLGEFSEGIGGLLDLTGLTGGAGGAAGKVIAGVIKRQPRDVPALKKRIAAALREAKTRILVMVDDIDRLEETEVRQLFTVIKALADFPFVTYLLAFDHEVAAKAIEAESHLPGDRYLEKIIQVPFHLPAVDRVALRNALFRRLDDVLLGTPVGAFENGYWANVYLDGIDPMIRVPRDIVRLVNTLSVTYPAVLGEVNPVDFIAIEAIRVFLPGLYDTLRANPDRFAGHSRDSWGSSDRDNDRAFHDKWMLELPEETQGSARALIERLFPKTGRTGYGSDWLREWRLKLRVCHPDVFPVYFRLSLPSGAVSRAEIVALIASLVRPDEFKANLLKAKSQRRLDGIPKVRELLERLMDHIEKDIQEKDVEVAVASLLDIGDDLIDRAEDRAMFDIGDDMRVARPVYHLLKRIEPPRRREVLEQSVRAARGVVVPLALLISCDQAASKRDSGREPPLFEPDDLKSLWDAWISKVKVLAHSTDALRHPQFERVLAAWRHWGNPSEVREACAAFVVTDAGLLSFISIFLQHTTSIGVTDRTVTRRPRLDPLWIEPFVDVEGIAVRLLDLRERGAIPETNSVAVNQFLKERGLRAAGKDPNNFDSLQGDD